ncbi:MAG: hypothetical protein A2504_15720 [Bdellovibrionales bacterium RIFOXYD12_FULL_39_22]|nr:MAG: hypothetical protein A2385_03150 [Bdellovibrionales bacterium RIFOXYB1_FULL_39_21]OFZ43241.1 MAG: hypothetical protein A2485_12295 [Bdellovibrionales bacterium RIFOXYC12_FULL_39_17]OFZ47979.1 MAG: hypothetical protein A2404_16935 [Bdellovibrionales bacterium RIFOXYC1_FULL_39_130]OFZ72744.1 MAG: hypothetical protein A2451_08435 [Bdellovibrionales bacterium RIFOXYC2_FULL_39_8]OFZ75759.1 MAG: hypothetical protein A2560_13435 [Bdellovibrionales bacterium RIFOXYD1_FULL_39_84]OFZ94249.1 MAG:
MKILVTGATGFVGKNLCKHLIQEGHQIFAQARNLEKFNKLKIPGTLIEGDFSISSIPLWVKKLPDDLDLIIHTAAVVHSFRAKDYYETNFDGTNVLVRELSFRYKKLTFVLISSLAVSGPARKHREVLNEKDGYGPINDYGQSKFLAELVIRDNTPKTWQNIILRPPIIVGAEDDAFFELIEMIEKGLAIYPGKEGNSKLYSFVAIEDLVENTIKAITSKNRLPFDIYFIANPTPVTFEKIVTEIQKNLSMVRLKAIHIPIIILHLFALILFLLNRLGMKIKIRITNDKVTELAQSGWVCSPQKSQTDLNATYKISIEESIKSTVNSYLQIRRNNT